ncbi:hypothetical protein LTS09_016661, partial [Friedmanniomyces endolithicus]
SKSATTGYSLHEIIFGFNTYVDALGALRDLAERDCVELREEAREMARSAI